MTSLSACRVPLPWLPDPIHALHVTTFVGAFVEPLASWQDGQSRARYSPRGVNTLSSHGLTLRRSFGEEGLFGSTSWRYLYLHSHWYRTHVRTEIYIRCITSRICLPIPRSATYLFLRYLPLTSLVSPPSVCRLQHSSV